MERQAAITVQLDETRNGLEHAKNELETFKQDASLWQNRYHELVDEKAKYEPEEIARLRYELFLKFSY